jgi:hypothetical protein
MLCWWFSSVGFGSAFLPIHLLAEHDAINNSLVSMLLCLILNVIVMIVYACAVLDLLFAAC